ncbi:hypothetical protein, partial [Enterococcus canis]
PNNKLGTPTSGERVEGPGNDFLVGLGNAQGFLLDMTEKGLKTLLRTFQGFFCDLDRLIFWRERWKTFSR